MPMIPAFQASLTDTEDIVTETQEIGEKTLLQLDAQRGQFAQTRDKARQVQDFTLETRSKITEMSQRRARKRGMLWTIIVTQLVIIFGLCYRSVVDT
ncbi:hypothetical protein CTAYLR_005206 [Chrysophaeum taylorii]|uniref:Uncharacterized protein n=1 Tax=Chrysophaeum taylorii TaxID=2483200 RepID=A0AAD7UAZ0_9STRA|nr:hypothetical protein CTAYLR_005206 [Chrysophaeum taylorii]